VVGAARLRRALAVALLFAAGFALGWVFGGMDRDVPAPERESAGKLLEKDLEELDRELGVK
jgi:hypothetical protein